MFAYKRNADFGIHVSSYAKYLNNNLSLFYEFVHFMGKR